MNRSRQREHAFTLLELMIVVAVIAIVAAVAIPSLQNARISANEAAAIAHLRSFASAMEQYRTRFGAYTADLNELQTSGYLAGFSPNSTGGVRKGGYFHRRWFSAAIEWGISAEPITPGSTGNRYFWIDSSGVIRVNQSDPAFQWSPPLD